MLIRYLILALTTHCNLQCSYCYNGDLYCVEDMSETVMLRAVSLVAGGGQPFHLQLTGGEPTLVPALIERAAVLAHETGRCGSIGIQTNATCLTPDLLDIFRTYQIEVGVSLDGPPSIHQQQRGMAAETLRGLHLLETAGIPFRVTTVVTQANAAVLDGLVLTKASAFCHVCQAESMAVQPDGGIFPCGQTMGDAQYAAGTVWAPHLDKLKSLNNHRPQDAPCSSCSLESTCSGDCPSRLHYNRHENSVLACDLYQSLWQFINGDE